MSDILEKPKYNAVTVANVLQKCRQTKYFGWMVNDMLLEKDFDQKCQEDLAVNIQICEKNGGEIPQWVILILEMGYKETLVHIIASALATGDCK